MWRASSVIPGGQQVIFSIVHFIIVAGRNMNEDNSCFGVCIPVASDDTLKSLGKYAHYSIARRL